MTTITGTLLDAAGAGVTGVAVTARLVAAAGTLTAGGEIIRQAGTTSAAGGAWSLDLTPTSALAYPAGAYYLVEADGRRWPIVVPDTGTHELSTVLADAPADRAPVGLTQTAADARYEQLGRKGNPGGYAALDGNGRVPASQLPAASGGTLDPADTVTAATAYGQATDPGTAVTYSRGDHSHGSPAAPTLASIGAAAADHTHPAAGEVFPLAAYGLTAATDNPMHFMGSGPVQSNEIHFARLWVPAGVAITNLWVAVRDAGVYDGVTPGNRIGIYDAAGAQLATTAEDPTLFTANGWRGGPLTGGPIAPQDAGRFVYLGALPRGMTTVPQLAFPASATDTHVAWWAAGPGGGNRRGFYLGGQANLPATIDPGQGGTGNTSTFVPLYGVS